jgi:hypothetical protein
MISPFPGLVTRPGRPVDSRAAATQATHDNREYPEWMPKGDPDRGAAGFAVLSLALQIPERFRSIGVVKDVPAGGLVKNAVHGVPPS